MSDRLREMLTKNAELRRGSKEPPHKTKRICLKNVFADASLADDLYELNNVYGVEIYSFSSGLLADFPGQRGKESFISFEKEKQNARFIEQAAKNCSFSLSEELTLNKIVISQPARDPDLLKKKRFECFFDELKRML